MKPWEFIDGSGRTFACSWCQRDMGVTPQAGESHGICQRHKEIELSKIGLSRLQHNVVVSPVRGPEVPR